MTLGFGNWTTQEIITAAVAAYGAVLSTFNLLAARREKKRILRVVWEFVGAPEAFAHIAGRSTTIHVTISNPGHVRVAIQEYGLIGPRGTGIAVAPTSSNIDEIPFALDPPDTISVWYDRAHVALALRESGLSGVISLRAYCIDTLRTCYRSKAGEFDTSYLQSL